MKKLWSIILWLVRLFKRDEPEVVRRKDQNEIDKALVSGDADRVNVMLDDELERLRHKGRGDK